MELDRLEFKADYAADCEKNFIVVTKEGLKGSDVVDFQVEMISKTKIPGVLEFYLREIDMEMRFYYNVTGLINLSNFLRRRTITKNQFIEILEGIINTLTQSKRYLLTDRCFVLMENYIYIDPVNLNTYLIYIPVDDRSDLYRSFRALVNNLLIDCANIETNDNFVQKVFGIIKKDGLCLSDFLMQLKKLKSNALEKDLEHQKVFQSSFDGASNTGHKLNWDKPGLSKPLEEGQLFGHESTSEAVSGSSGRNLSVIAGVASLGLISGLWFYTKQSDLLTGLPQLLQRHSTWAGAFVLTGLLATFSYFIIKRQSGERKFSFHEGLSQSAASFQESSQQDFLGNPAFMEASMDAVVGINIGRTSGTNTDRAGSTYADETVLLAERKHPVLVCLNGVDKIVLNKPDIVVGRNKEICDCVIENKGVGRAHARITTAKGKCFLTDLDSTNGTFINGAKLISNKEYEIKYNDRILLANVEFCFECP